jgi:PAS domain S-box-containing protein
VNSPRHILILEDNPTDAELSERELRKTGIEALVRVVKTRGDFVRELETFAPDLILADYNLPAFDGLAALALAREKFPDVPFIFLTDARGEERAIETLLSGATDYVVKERLARLGPSANRALGEREERKKLRQTETRLVNAIHEWRSTFDAITDLVTLLDREGKIMRCNKGMASFLRKPFNAIFGKSLHGLVSDAEWTVFRELIDRTRTNRRRELAIAHLRDHWYRIAIDPLIDDPETAAGAALIMIDITAHKRSEDALRESEKRHRSLFENMLEGYAYCKLLFAEGLPHDFIYLATNSAFERLTGLQDVVGRKVTEVLPGIREAHPELFQIFSRVVATGTPERFEVFSESFGGWLAIAVYRANESCFVSVFDNITDRKRMEEALQKHTEDLEETVRERTQQYEQASKSKSDFLANMSHELRTPLNSILGFSQILQNELYGALNAKQKGYINDIFGSGQHLLALINDILDLAKVESGRMELSVCPVSVRDIIIGSAAMFREKANKHGIRMDIEIGPDADLQMEADERKLKQIMFNLLSNAVKFTPDGGSVRVAVRRVQNPKRSLQGSEDIDPELRTHNPEPDADFIEITVADTGIGIRPEDLGKLFQEFTQLQSPYTKGHEGTGLGLALTRKLVELHGGMIGVTSEYAKGSEFVFTMPIRQRMQDRAPAAHERERKEQNDACCKTDDFMR